MANVRDVPIGHLKSNMDRFIVIIQSLTRSTHSNLKSNMDRFIVY